MNFFSLRAFFTLIPLASHTTSTTKCDSSVVLSVGCSYVMNVFCGRAFIFYIKYDKPAHNISMGTIHLHHKYEALKQDWFNILLLAC